MNILRFINVVIFVMVFMFVNSVYGEMKITLDHFIESDGIWKGEDNNYYLVDSGKRNGSGTNVFTEIEISSDGQSFKKKKALVFGTYQQWVQVDLAQIVENFPVKVWEYYIKGDKAIFNNRELSLEGFLNGDGMWKADNKYYTVAVDEAKGKSSYVLNEVSMTDKEFDKNNDRFSTSDKEIEKIVSVGLTKAEKMGYNLAPIYVQHIRSSDIVTNFKFTPKLKQNASHFPEGATMFINVGNIPAKIENVILQKGEYGAKKGDRFIKLSNKAYKSSPRIETSKSKISSAVETAILPSFKFSLQGNNEVRIKNPNDFKVTVGLRSGKKGKDFDVPSNGVSSVYIPDGGYDIYFVYSNKPDALFQGDSFTLSNNGIEIQVVKVVGGNYGIHQVK